MEALQQFIEAWQNSSLLWPRILYGSLALAWVGGLITLVFIILKERREDNYASRYQVRRYDYRKTRR